MAYMLAREEKHISALCSWSKEGQGCPKAGRLSRRQLHGHSTVTTQRPLPASRPKLPLL